MVWGVTAVEMGVGVQGVQVRGWGLGPGAPAVRTYILYM